MEIDYDFDGFLFDGHLPGDLNVDELDEYDEEITEDDLEELKVEED